MQRVSTRRVTKTSHNLFCKYILSNARHLSTKAALRKGHFISRFKKTTLAATRSFSESRFWRNASSPLKSAPANRKWFATIRKDGSMQHYVLSLSVTFVNESLCSQWMWIEYLLLMCYRFYQVWRILGKIGIFDRLVHFFTIFVIFLTDFRT
jgi:hypothetical protein